MSPFPLIEEEIIMKPYRLFALTLGLLLACNTLASAEILALLNYESKPNQPVRREGIAIMDIDPESGNFGKILMEIPLPPDLVAHHIFFNRDRSKPISRRWGKAFYTSWISRRFPTGFVRSTCRTVRSARISPCRRITELGTSPAILALR